MKISVQTRQDLVCIILWVAAGLALAFLLTSGVPGWARRSGTWIWFETCALIFFVRPVFSPPNTRPAWVNFPLQLGRSVGVFLLSLVPLQMLDYGWLPVGPGEFDMGVYLWALIPIAAGCATFTVGFFCRLMSKGMGY